MQLILKLSEPVIYGAQALSAIFGVWVVILLMNMIRKKRFPSEASAQSFLGEVRSNLQSKNFEAVVELCDSPPHWTKVVPQLILVALANKDRPIPKLRGLLSEKFDRDVLADLQYRHSWINTMIKTAPMLGLLGTVTGMIMAFAKLAAASQGGTDPKQLADDIALALYTTMWGLTIAIPLTVLGAMVQTRIGKLADSVQQHINEFVEDFETYR